MIFWVPLEVSAPKDWFFGTSRGFGAFRSKNLERYQKNQSFTPKTSRGTQKKQSGGIHLKKMIRKTRNGSFSQCLLIKNYKILHFLRVFANFTIKQTARQLPESGR